MVATFAYIVQSSNRAANKNIKYDLIPCSSIAYVALQTSKHQKIGNKYKNEGKRKSECLAQAIRKLKWQTGQVPVSNNLETFFL